MNLRLVLVAQECKDRGKRKLGGSEAKSSCPGDGKASNLTMTQLLYSPISFSPLRSLHTGSTENQDDVSDKTYPRFWLARTHTTNK